MEAGSLGSIYGLGRLVDPDGGRQAGVLRWFSREPLGVSVKGGVEDLLSSGDDPGGSAAMDVSWREETKPGLVVFVVVATSAVYAR